MNISAHLGRTLGGKRIADSTAFCMTALSEARVALVMGSAFGAEGYARMSFATDLQTLERGFDSLANFLRDFRRPSWRFRGLAAAAIWSVAGRGPRDRLCGKFLHGGLGCLFDQA